MNSMIFLKEENEKLDVLLAKTEKLTKENEEMWKDMEEIKKLVKQRFG